MHIIRAYIGTIGSFIKKLAIIIMRTKIFILFIVIFPNTVLGQLYKCDSTYHNKDFTIWKSYKNGLKHGGWEYRSKQDLNSISKYEYYWFDELVFEDTTNIYCYPMFHFTDTLIEYSFGPVVDFVISKHLVQEAGEHYICKLSINKLDQTELLFFIQANEGKNNNLDQLLRLTNRYLILEKQNIPIISDYDFRFANLGWTINYDFKIVLNSKNLILEIYK